MEENCEQRNYLRLPLDCDLTYQYDDKIYHGQVLDISKGGIKFIAQKLIPLFSRISVTLLKEPPVLLQGLTIWSDDHISRPSISIKFENLSEEQKYFLSMLLVSKE